MSKHGAEEQGDPGAAQDGPVDGHNAVTAEGDDPDPGRVLAAFDPPEPLTAAEVADAVDADRMAVDRTLTILADRGDVASKSVGREASVTVWYRTATGEAAAVTGDDPTEGDDPDGETDDGGSTTADWTDATIRGSDGATPGPADGDGIDGDVAAAIDDLSVPGTSGMMRDWRRDAVRAAYLHLRAAGEATSGQIVEATYGSHRAGYDDPDRWWAFVADRLADLPGAERDGDRWRHVG